MTAFSQSIKRKLLLPQLADELGNIALEALREFGPAAALVADVLEPLREIGPPAALVSDVR